MNLTFRQLRVFLEVAQQGSVTRAAAALHLTPPAVSMQIKEIESQVGLPLFDRSGRRLSLSTTGEYFSVHAKRMLATLRDAENAMGRFKRLEHGLLTVGMVSTAKYFVPRLLALFRGDHPGIDVRLVVTVNREALLPLLESGDCDLAVMGRPPRELATRAEPFAAHPLVFVGPPQHELLGMGGCRWRRWRRFLSSCANAARARARRWRSCLPTTASSRASPWRWAATKPSSKR